jgi:hypothetical protein
MASLGGTPAADWLLETLERNPLYNGRLDGGDLAVELA